MSTGPLSVAVLISAGRNPVSGVPRACRGDVAAMAVGRSLAGDGLRVVHAGRADDPALADYLALGASTIEALAAPEGTVDVPQLASHLAACDIILTGLRAESEMGSGLLPYALGNALDRPIIANVLDVTFEANEVKVSQFLPKGKRRGIAAQVPVILAIHPLAGTEFNYAYARRAAGRIVAQQAVAVSEPVSPSSPWTVSPGLRRPVRLKAEAPKAGHARLLSAIAPEAKGGVVAFDGSPVDKAQIVFNYLREHHLIDF
jgi:electron transfer flavoprotein beta subunit